MLGKEAYRFIRSVLSAGSRVLELGSGDGTGRLVEYYQVYTVEHDSDWLHKCKADYIYAPLVNGWYHLSREQLPVGYDLLIIDGPPGEEARSRFIAHVGLFDVSKWVLVDDINRPSDFEVFRVLASGRRFVQREDDNKEFGIIFPAI